MPGHNVFNERCVRPEKGLRVKRAVSATVFVDALDGAVETSHQLSPLMRCGSPADDRHDRSDRPFTAGTWILEKYRMMLDAGGQAGMHVLQHRFTKAIRQAENRQATEVLPHQPVGVQRGGEKFGHPLAPKTPKLIR